MRDYFLKGLVRTSGFTHIRTYALLREPTHIRTQLARTHDLMELCPRDYEREYRNMLKLKRAVLGMGAAVPGLGYG